MDRFYNKEVETAINRFESRSGKKEEAKHIAAVDLFENRTAGRVKDVTTKDRFENTDEGRAGDITRVKSVSQE